MFHGCGFKFHQGERRAPTEYGTAIGLCLEILQQLQLTKMQCFYLTLQVYLVRFVVMQEHEENLVISTDSSEIISFGYRSGPSVVKSLPPKIMKSDNPGTPIPETTFPASVSIGDLFNTHLWKV